LPKVRAESQACVAMLGEWFTRSPGKSYFFMESLLDDGDLDQNQAENLTVK
jgi:hypothetical protein